MAYALNTLDGKTLLAVIADKDDMDSGVTAPVSRTVFVADDNTCLNKIARVLIRNNGEVAVFDENGNEFLTIDCGDYDDASTWALDYLGWTCILETEND